MLEWRLKAFRHWLTMTEPTWANIKYPPIDYQKIIYYSAPKQMKKLDRDAVALGLEPIYEPGRLDEIQDDLEVKIRLLLSQRNKPTRDRQ